MTEILDELKRGSTQIGPIFKECVEMWAELLDDADNLTVEELAAKLLPMQKRIEVSCNHKIRLGKAITAVSGFAYLDEDVDRFDNTGETAEKLYQAFGNSMVAQEVKYAVEIAVKLYHLVD